MRRHSMLARSGLLAGFGACALVAAVHAGEGAPPVRPVLAGQPFPAASFKNLNAAAGGAETVDLAQVLGKKPVVFCYWIAGNRHSEEVLVQLQSLVGELGAERLALYSFVLEQPGRGVEIIRSRIEAQAIRVPVLNDEGFKIGNQLLVQSVPSIAIVDRDGRLRLANGASLAQTLEYKMNVEAAVRRVAQSGSLGTYGYLDRYFPVQELVGKRCPDFEAPLLTGSGQQRWTELMDNKKLNVLIFWSVDCPHCRKSMPEINDWLKQNPQSVNVISAAQVSNATVKIKTKEFCDSHGFVFPTLEDADQKLSEQFLVTSTPTILIIRPDGVVDSVMLSDLTDFGKAIEERKRRLAPQVGS